LTALLTIVDIFQYQGRILEIISKEKCVKFQAVGFVNTVKFNPFLCQAQHGSS
jgi:hypothetical protein